MLPSNELRIRVAHPTSRAVEELTELVMRPDVAKFLYFGGSARRPELADELTDVAERFEAASPATAAHLRAALGEHAARDTKYISLRDGARTISVRTGDPAAAVHHLDMSMRLASEQRTLPPVALERLAEDVARARAAMGDGGRRRSPARNKGRARKR